MTQRLLSAPPWASGDTSTQSLLAAAAQTWESTSTSEQYIQEALSQPNAELDIFVSAYRYYFYKNNNAKALEMATEVLTRIQQEEQWPTDWDALRPIVLARIDDPIVRLYLSAYAASGLLWARLGQVETAQEIADQMQPLQAKEFGAEVLQTILNPPPEEED